MGNVKIIFVNESPLSGKSSLCLALATYLKKADFKVSIFDCGYSSPIYFKRDDEKKATKRKDNFPIIPFSLVNDKAINSLLNEINQYEKVYLFDIPSVISPLTYTHLLIEADFWICPFLFSVESIHLTASYIKFLQKLRVGFETLEKKKITSKLILIPNMYKEDSISLVGDLWKICEKAFKNYAEISPPVKWHDNFFNEQSTLSFLQQFSPTCGECFDFIKQKLPAINKSNLETDE